MDTQQLASKVAQLESRVAAVEDEGKIVKGEVKQILTEIRSAILVRDNPFEGDGGMSGGSFGVGVTVSSAPAARAPEPAPAPPPPPPPPPTLPQPEPARPAAPQEAATQPEPTPAREPVMLRPHAPEPESERAALPQIPASPQWTLVTIAGLSAWAEEAMRRIGALRLEILLDLCEASGQLSPDARKALARVTELDFAEPADTPSTNETAAMLRQLDALLHDQEVERPSRLRRAS